MLAALALLAATPVPTVVASPAYKSATARLDQEHDRIVSEIITLTEIPAPPFKEAKRAAAYAEMLRAAGLQDVEIDAEGNAMGLWRGTGAAGRPLIVIAAHLDTVFPEETNVKVRREGTRLLAPGIGDDTRSLAVLLAYARAMKAAGVRTDRPGRRQPALAGGLSQLLREVLSPGVANDHSGRARRSQEDGCSTAAMAPARPHFAAALPPHSPNDRRAFASCALVGS